MSSSSPIVCIRRGQSGYPELLGRITDPPDQLYCRGNTELLASFCIGVVGTRRASDYGRRVATDIARGLATTEVTVVSGLALGIDAISHRATLDVGGRTIAVLGGGVDDANIGPSSNQPLAHDILATGGLIVSEYPAGQSAHPGTFPIRNRIISGLSKGVLVVEADLNSGSLITAKSALDQNRDVFAVPGSIYWPRSIGTNWLISQGARPVTCAQDILESYRLRQVPLPAASVSTEDPDQQGILALLREHGPMHMDKIAESCGHDASRVMVAITLLELSGALTHQGAGIYRIS